MNEKRSTRLTKTCGGAPAEAVQWFLGARFGMFIHWGLYARLARDEWAMHREGIPHEEYATLADGWNPRPGAPREWAKLAKKAGMKYMVLTTKHHEGYCLWDTQQTDFNAVRRGPGRDLVAEYVEACRAEGLKVGLYYSLMDWRHPDGTTCETDEQARKRFIRFTHACVRELMSNYGHIDILWYDCPFPLMKASLWESRKLNTMVRKLQPHILINNRSRLDEDFGTPEGEVKPADAGRPWEACMTFNSDWGYVDRPEGDWRSARKVLRMLQTATAGGGNLLLNVGPMEDGTLPEMSIERLETVGRWIKKHAEVLYGDIDRIDGALTAWGNVGYWTRRGKVGYHWIQRGYPGREFSIGGMKSKVRSVSLVGSKRKLVFEQVGERLIIRNLPPTNPEKVLGVPVLKVEFVGTPKQAFKYG